MLSLTNKMNNSDIVSSESDVDLFSLQTRLSGDCTQHMCFFSIHHSHVNIM